MARRVALPDKERPAQNIKVDDEIYVLHDSGWRRVDKRIELYNAYKFVLDNGQEYFAERGQRVRCRHIPSEES